MDCMDNVDSMYSMDNVDNKNIIYLGKITEIDPIKTFECGQCFRWNADASGGYIGVVRGMPARVWAEGGDVFLYSADAGSSNYEMWRDYFALDVDYGAIDFSGVTSEYFDACRSFGEGIRILRQEKWEVLCSFIISQCNNIPRIKGIVEALCREFGQPVSLDGMQMYTFPSAEAVAALSAEDLAVIRSGYRARYILDAARAVSAGETELEALAKVSRRDALAGLLKLNGVGVKVANCVLLFGLGHMSGFPVDVWMKRALTAHFPKDFNPDSFGEYAGLAQQYIFYYAREHGEA